MRLPSPSGKQDKGGFISSCMSNDNMKKEFPDQKQRAAVCYSQFKKAASKAAVIVSNPWDDEDIFYYFSD